LPDSVEIPNLVGLTWNEEQIRLQLEESTLLVAAVEVESTEYPAGTIINQAPLGGTFRQGGTTITVEVATAPPAPERFDIPGVLGLTLGEAKQVLAGNGFGVNTVIQQLDDQKADPAYLAPGIVWQQDPPAGGSLAVGQIVTIWVNPDS
jgi:beta-lactam-binding protein with PASTA domain